ncbi:MAG: class I SAM-dependent methyltransferase [SAR202 cluster bacterium]|nr:class I SAM-dependent methyltransferase [SAR202 cluster bacterium]
MPDSANTPQNIYDDPEFFAGYSTLERFGEGWEKAGERAEFLGLLPDVKGLRVLDLGCGAGQLSRYLAEQGAASVVGVDLSEKMLELARAKWAHPRVTYQRDALETASFPNGSFDLVVSSLAFHYVEDYVGLVRRIAGWLRPGGALVFSTEHPVFTARLPGDGWVSGGEGGGRRWAIDRYADEGPRQENWFVRGVRKAHRTFATLVNGLLDAGLAIERVVEPVASEQWLRDHPDWPDEWRRPTFLLVRARKP